jgi:hypothetical protein
LLEYEAELLFQHHAPISCMKNVKPIALIIAILLVSVPVLTAVPTTTSFAQESDEEEDGSESESTDESEPEPEPTCPEDQVLEDGECVDRTDITCPEGQVLEDGECVEPPEPTPTQCDPPEVPCDDGGGGTGPTEPPAVPVPTPTPTPQPTPARINSSSTNPSGLIQQPVALGDQCPIIMNVDGNASTLLSSGPSLSTTNSVTLKGKVDVSVKSKNGYLPLKYAKVELIRSDGTPSNNIAHTNEEGIYTLSLPKDFLTTQCLLRVTLENKGPQDKFGIHYGTVQNKVVFVETNLADYNLQPVNSPLTTVMYNADIRFEINSKLEENKLRLNNGLKYEEFKPSKAMNDQNITPMVSTPIGRYPQLAAIYFYINFGMEFINSDLKDLVKFKDKQLKVVGFAGGDLKFDPRAWSILIPESVSKLFVRVATDSEKDKQIDPVESDVDGILHEFGHYISTRISGNIPAAIGRPAVNQDIRGMGLEGNAHAGYAITTSAAPFDEGLATFLSAVISTKFSSIDKVNSKLGGPNAEIYIQYDGLDLNTVYRLYLEKGTLDNSPLHIVGKENKPLTNDDKPTPTRKGVYYIYNPVYEEASLASVLWDFYDPIGDDRVTVGLPPLLKAVLDPRFATKSMGGQDISFHKAYLSMEKGQYLIIRAQEKANYNQILANFGICIDKNKPLGTCTPDEVDQGKSAWRSKHVDKYFEYPTRE